MSGHFRFFILPSIVTSKIGFLNFKSCISITNLLHHHHNHPFFSEKKKNEGKNGIELKKRTQLQKFDEGLLCALSLKYDVVNATPLKCAYNIEGNHRLSMIADWSGGKEEASIVV